MTASEVPVAGRLSYPMSRMSIGTTITPPPTPNRALKNPAVTPMPANTTQDRRASGTAVF